MSKIQIDRINRELSNNMITQDQYNELQFDITFDGISDLELNSKIIKFITENKSNNVEVTKVDAVEYLPVGKHRVNKEQKPTNANKPPQKPNKILSTEYVDDGGIVGSMDDMDPIPEADDNKRIVLRIGSDIMHKDVNFGLYMVFQALKTYNDDPFIQHHPLYLDDFKMDDIADLVASPKGGSITRKNVYEQIKLMDQEDLLIYDKENRVLEIPKVQEGETIRPFNTDVIFKLTTNIKSDNLKVWMYLRNQKSWFDSKGQQTQLSFTNIYNACFGQVGTLTDKVKAKLEAIDDDKLRASETKKAINKKSKSDLKKISNIFKELKDQGYLKYITIKQNKDGWSSINSIGAVIVPEVDRRDLEAIEDAPNVIKLKAM